MNLDELFPQDSYFLLMMAALLKLGDISFPRGWGFNLMRVVLLKLPQVVRFPRGWALKLMTVVLLKLLMEICFPVGWEFRQLVRASYIYD